MKKPRVVRALNALCSFIFLLVAYSAVGQQLNSTVTKGETDLHRAARAGDLSLIDSKLKEGMNPNVRDQLGRTPLLEAVSAGKLNAMQMLLVAGANASAQSSSGRTPLIEAAERGQLEAAGLLIRSGADLNTIQRGYGSALETAERAGHNDVAAMLRQAGAKSSGRSIGDTVCVRPWQGEGYCGKVEAVNKTAFTIRVTEIVGCTNGCSAKAECSASRTVGGTDGIQVGEAVSTVSWCLTHTGVQP
jgi:hypothetical protein